MSGEASKRKTKIAKGKGKKSLVEEHHKTNGVSPGGIKRTSNTMLGVAPVAKVESNFKEFQVEIDLAVNLNHHIVQTEFGNFSVHIQGDLETKKDGVVFLTVHDIGSNHKPLARFTSLPCMDEIATRALFVHICLPGQDKHAADFGADFPTMQDLSFGLWNILVHLEIPQVIGLGLGAGANILCRLAIHSPNKVLGLVAIQPTASAATVMELLKQRIVSLKLGSIENEHGPDTDQFLVYHKFGNLVENAEDAEKYKKRLHTDLNPRNLKLFVESYMKRTEILDEIKAKIKCDVLIVVGSNSSFVKQTEAMHRQSNLEKTSLIKLENVGDVLLESPEKLSEAILFFCQGLGLMPSILGPRSRNTSECKSGKNSRKSSLTMMSADVPNLRRFSVSADPPSVTVTEVEKTQESNQEATEKVYATAVIENSPVENPDYREIYNIVTKEHHMRANIAEVSINYESTREFRPSLFTHTSSLVLTVKTAGLKETPKQFIWKHLGRNDWKKENGTSIKFVKIHVK